MLNPPPNLSNNAGGVISQSKVREDFTRLFRDHVPCYPAFQRRCSSFSRSENLSTGSIANHNYSCVYQSHESHENVISIPIMVSLMLVCRRQSRNSDGARSPGFSWITTLSVDVELDCAIVTARPRHLYPSPGSSVSPLLLSGGSSAYMSRFRCIQLPLHITSLSSKMNLYSTIYVHVLRRDMMALYRHWSIRTSLDEALVLLNYSALTLL
ncbi:hypothetical protein BDV96DRAFT_4418 [Lophiotrema nucula]|uniref:Uncharacterized protein n=1 Tax=Lophiotrema nucula TaxID=690887 RepID=A0A6A5ZWD7_9PLEO|nr:hypothetical protein BDV96DRAFT_4418 [Lophiotrema nucula]